MDTQRRRSVLVALAALLGLLLVPAVDSAPAAAEAPDEPRAERSQDAPRSDDDALAAQARAEGEVRVLIEVAADVRPEGELGPDRVRAQRAEIARQAAAVRRELAGTGAEVLRDFDAVPYLAARVSEDALEALADSPAVRDVRRDEPMEVALDDSTKQIQADLLWERGLGGAGTTVAVLDTGVEADHPALEGRVVDEACFSGGGSSSESFCPNGLPQQTGPGAAPPCEGDAQICPHGTHVAGIVSGVAPGADLMAIQVFSEGDCSGRPCALAFRSDILAGLGHVLERAETHNVVAANLSISAGLSAGHCDYETQFKSMIDHLRSVGIATVVATGNQGDTGAVGLPSCVSSAVAVAATGTASDGTEQIAAYSNRRPDLVDLVAPGDRIESAGLDGTTRTDSGTSMAAPHVAGAWALVRQHLDGASVDQVEGLLRSAAVPVADGDLGDYDALRLDPASLGFDLEVVAACLRAPFTDVPIGHTFCPAIDWMSQQGLTSGYPDGTFQPTRAVTRQAVAAFLYELAGSPPVAQVGDDFADVGAGHPFAEAITWMADEGISVGYLEDGERRFRPDRDVARQAVAKFLHEFEGRPTSDEEPVSFADIDDDHPFVDAIRWMGAEGISVGYLEDGERRFAPTRAVTRQAVAKFLFELEQVDGSGDAT